MITKNVHTKVKADFSEYDNFAHNRVKKHKQSDNHTCKQTLRFKIENKRKLN